MGLAEQERALLALLWDEEFRNRFLENKREALSAFGLSDDEKADFEGVHPLGLRVDVEDRATCLLGRMTASYPLSMSALSAFPEAFRMARRGVTLASFESPVGERAVAFGRELERAMGSVKDASPQERSLLEALLAWELGLAETAAQVRKSLLSPLVPPQGGQTASDSAVRPDPDRLQWAPHVTVALLPRPLASLRTLLCPTAPMQLYARLVHGPLPRARLRDALQAQPTLVVAKALGEGPLSLGPRGQGSTSSQPPLEEGAVASGTDVGPKGANLRPTPCEATVSHKFVELSHGFAFLVPYFNGALGRKELLARLGATGAAPAMVERVAAVLSQLSREGFLLGT